MKKFLLKAYLTDNGQPMLCEESASYNVDMRKAYDDPKRIYDLACQLGCDKMAEESLYCLCLDSKLRVVGLFLVSSGTIDQTIFSVRELFQKALLLGAVKIVVWHNHPSDDPTPSMMDVQMTKRIQLGGEILGVELLDHIIVARSAYTSLQEEGVL